VAVALRAATHRQAAAGLILRRRHNEPNFFANFKAVVD